MSWRLGEEGFPWPLSSLQGDRLYLGEQNKTLYHQSQGPGSSLGESMSRDHLICPLPAWDGRIWEGWGKGSQAAPSAKSWWGCGQVSRERSTKPSLFPSCCPRVSSRAPSPTWAHSSLTW